MSNQVKTTQNPNPNNGALNLLTIVIPARDEADNIETVIKNLHLELVKQNVNNEIVVVDEPVIPTSFVTQYRQKVLI